MVTFRVTREAPTVGLSVGTGSSGFKFRSNPITKLDLPTPVKPKSLKLYEFLEELF